MKIGYARVSRVQQNLNLQIDALKKAGCEKIITDEISGAISNRPGLNRLKDLARSGDVIVIWRLDRLGRSLTNLIELVNEFKSQGIGLESLQEHINTTTSTGQLIFHVFGALAEFERNLIRERTYAGLAAARSRGRKGGRPSKVDEQGKDIIMSLYESKKYTLKEIGERMGISKPTIYKYIREVEAKTPKK